MNKRNLQNSELDAIGKKLIERGTSPSPEIDEIISNPNLFSLVQARIAAESGNKAAVPFARRQISFFLRRNGLALSGAAVLVIAIIASANFLRTQKTPIAANAVQPPATVTPVAARPEVLPPQADDRNLTTGRAQDRDVRYEKAVVKQTQSIDARRPQRHINTEPDPDFYAISSPGNPDDASTGERIIRVNVKRSSLFAMGINVPLENDDEVVKADLLVGSDGVTRAIRVIK